jgi:hypothetical protein
LPCLWGGSLTESELMSTVSLNLRILVSAANSEHYLLRIKVDILGIIGLVHWDSEQMSTRTSKRRRALGISAHEHWDSAHFHFIYPGAL